MKAVRPAPNKGFTLLEGILALFLFTVAAVALTEALNIIGIASLEGQESARVEDIIRTYLTEKARAPEIEIGTESFKLPDGLTSVRVTAEELDLYNLDGVQLTDMMRIEVVAFRKELGREVILESAETYRYNPLYQNRGQAAPTPAVPGPIPGAPPTPGPAPSSPPTPPQR